MAKEKNNLDKEFALSSWAIKNKTTIYVAMALILFFGISAYFSMPRESFPEVKETKIYVSSIYPGNTAEDIEKLLTNPLEDKLKTVSNVVEITSTSQEDYSMIVVEFDEGIAVELAKQKVKDEIDSETSGEDWPTFNGAKVEPNVFELSLSEEIPILNINISGDYPVMKLKEFGEYLQDEIENLPEIKKVDNNNEDYVQYLNKQNTNNKNSILSTYDIFLNDKYNVELNQKTIERVKNFFQ